MLQRVDGGLGMGGVVGADAYAVQLLVVDELLVARIEAHALNAELLHESLGLAGDEIGGGDYLDVGHLLVDQYMALSYPAGANDTYLELTGSIHGLGLHIGSELGHDLVSLVAHFKSPLFCYVWICLQRAHSCAHAPIIAHFAPLRHSN